MPRILVVTPHTKYTKRRPRRLTSWKVTRVFTILPLFDPVSWRRCAASRSKVITGKYACDYPMAVQAFSPDPVFSFYQTTEAIIYRVVHK